MSSAAISTGRSRCSLWPGSGFDSRRVSRTRPGRPVIPPYTELHNDTTSTWEGLDRVTDARTIKPPLAPKARALLHEWVQSDSLRKHCEAVAACMGYFARKQGADEDLWTAVALLHDMAYERHPNLELSESGHPLVGVRSLREQG